MKRFFFFLTASNEHTPFALIHGSEQLNVYPQSSEVKLMTDSKIWNMISSNKSCIYLVTKKICQVELRKFIVFLDQQLVVILQKCSLIRMNTDHYKLFETSRRQDATHSPNTIIGDIISKIASK